MTTLPELIKNRMAELELSYRDLARAAGGLVSHGTIHAIASGRHAGHYDDKTLQGIALAINLPQSKVREAAGMDPRTPTEFRLPKKANRLTASERKAILAMVDALLDDQRHP